jgi:hypothetical protein
LEGRRVNIARPTDSLLLLKPTTQLDHGGGFRFSPDEDAAKRLHQWIAAGARRNVSPRQLRKLEVQPTTFTASQRNESVSLRATAYFTDGSVSDVSDWTVWQTGDASAVSIADGQATIRRPGQHTVVARFLHVTVPLQFVLPFGESSWPPHHWNARNFIDDHINATLQRLRLPASPPCDDAIFIRRLRLDLTGRLPTVAELRDFERDSASDKRSKLIDRLLASDDFVEYWTFLLAAQLRNRSLPNESAGAMALHRWLSQQLNHQRGWNDIVKELVLAQGDSHHHGPAWFWRLTNDPRSQAEAIGQAFLGVRLQCANCHNHPLDRWTQDDYHGLAALLAKVERGRLVRVGPRGDVTHPRTEEPARPQFPGVVIQGPMSDLRQPLADWLIQRDNPFVAKAIVNRLWKQMMGRGLVEPVDDLRETNPATHPELFNALAEDFAQQQFNLRHTLRTIALSAAYQRASVGSPADTGDDRFYSHALAKSLPAEILADAWADVTGVPNQYGELPRGTRAIALVDPATPSRTLDVLGRCSRRESCESSAATTQLPALLHRINGETINGKLSAANGRLRQLIAAGKSDEEIITEFFESALARRPTDDERQALGRPINGQRVQWLEDVVWSLLNSRAFTTVH